MDFTLFQKVLCISIFKHEGYFHFHNAIKSKHRYRNMSTRMQDNLDSNIRTPNKHYAQHHLHLQPNGTKTPESNIPPLRTRQLEHLIQEPLLGITQLATHTVSSSNRSGNNFRIG